jgi:hypothetical protein
MVASKEMYYQKNGEQVKGIWLIDINIIPHRWQPTQKKYLLEESDTLYAFHQPSILLSDINVIVGTDDTRSIETSIERKLETVFARAAKEET